MLFARTTGDHQAEILSVAEFLAAMELGEDFADDYRSIAVHRGPDARDGWASPDVAPLSVPLGEFLAEVDALLAAGESGQRSR